MAKAGPEAGVHVLPAQLKDTATSTRCGHAKGRERKHNWDRAGMSRAVCARRDCFAGERAFQLRSRHVRAAHTGAHTCAGYTCTCALPQT